MTMTPDDRDFIEQGKTILGQRWDGSYEEDQAKMYLGVLLGKYEELVSAGVSPGVEEAREFLVAALAESDADERDPDGGSGWDVEVDARTVLELLEAAGVAPQEPSGERDEAWDAYRARMPEGCGTVGEEMFAFEEGWKAARATGASVPSPQVHGTAHEWDSLDNCGRCGRGFVGDRANMSVKDCWPTPSPDHEKLRAEARAQAELDFPSAESYSQYVAGYMRGALAAPVAADRAKLTEILRPYDPDTPMDAALAVIERRAEWLGGGER